MVAETINFLTPEEHAEWREFVLKYKDKFIAFVELQASKRQEVLRSDFSDIDFTIGASLFLAIQGHMRDVPMNWIIPPMQGHLIFVPKQYLDGDQIDVVDLAAVNAYMREHDRQVPRSFLVLAQWANNGGEP